MKNRIYHFVLCLTGAYLVICQGLYAQQQLLKPGQPPPEKALQPGNQDALVLQQMRTRAKDGRAEVLGFDPAALQGSSLVLTLPGGHSVEAILDEKDERYGDDLSWHGHLRGQAGSVVILYQEGRLSGQVITGDKQYSLSPLGKGSSLLYQTAPSRYQQASPPRAAVSDPRKQNLGAVANHGRAIRLLVAFTPAVEKEILAMGYGTTKHFIQQSISEVNQSFINRGLDHRVSLAVALPLDYTESGNSDVDLDRFASATDGMLDDIHAYRTQYRADVSVLLFQNTRSGLLASGFRAKEGTGFCVAPYDYALGNAAFAQEIGRLHIQNALALQELTGTSAVSNAVPAVLRLNGAASLKNQEVVYATATSEIILEPGFEATGDAELWLAVKPAAADPTPAFAKPGVGRPPVTGEEELLTDITLTDLALSIGPVPTSSTLDIEVNLPKAALAEIAIYNTQGAHLQNVYKGELDHRRFTVDLGRYPVGIYIVRVRTLGQEISKKVILAK
jgi:Secretion system C-terminal sorting domain